MQSSFSQILKRSYAKGKRSVASERFQRVQQLIDQGRTKLSYEKAAEIRSSTESSAVLAERYGVGRGTINRVRAGEYWQDGGVSAFTWRP